MDEMSAVKTPSKASIKRREQCQKESQERKRSILHLIFKYLIEHDYITTAETLQNETDVGINYQVCDNIDLDIILQEYSSYYNLKFQKSPQILKKLEGEAMVLKKKPSGTKRISKNNDQIPLNEFEIDIKPLNEGNDDVKPEYNLDDYPKEYREMAEQVIKEIVPKSLGIQWQDCVGLNATIELLKEAILHPIIYPDLFKNISSWKGILLYGPPGNGKTLLAKALASESQNTFINLTSSTFTSKWRGESEKMVKILFDIAKIYSPTTIFIDEIDSLVPRNKESNHEASKRFKSELLTQIDGIIDSQDIFILGATNSPWDIEPALLRRLEKRILVPLPDETARTSILYYHLNKIGYKINRNDLLEPIVKCSKNFSGSELKTVCKEAHMILVREQVSNNKKSLRNITLDDIKSAINKVNPCIQIDCYEKYLDWHKKYGSI